MSLFEKKKCPNCFSNSYEIIYKSSYPVNISKKELKQLYCSSSESRLNEQLVSCSKCNLIYINPTVNKKIILNSYINAKDTTFISQNKYRVLTFERNFKKILNLLSLGSRKNLKVLDVGCAGGAFLIAAKKLGFSAVGIEPSKWLASFAKKTYKLNIKPGTLSSVPIKKNSIDILTMWDVLEHLVDPDNEVKRISYILKKSGILVINYPNYSSFARLLLQKKWPFFLSVHLTYFTPKTLEDFFKRRGFVKQFEYPYWQCLELGYVLKRASKYFIFLSFLSWLCEKFKIQHTPLFYNMGQTLVVFKKID
jgi:2-polyprenyl-3-methyl-5-hydroxy-6-metoxy-1,4-benzoquinol methylase